MGEAKRRKANDPTFGKKKGTRDNGISISKEKAQKWWEESKKSLDHDFVPDLRWKK